MNPKALRLFFALAAASILATTAHAEDLAKQVADGTAWTTLSPAGGSISITLQPDGTGRVGSGLFSRQLTWQGEGNRLCLPGLPGSASGCMMLTETKDGFFGRRDDGSELRLWR